MTDYDPVELLAKVLEYEHVLEHVADPHPVPGAPPHDACPECQRMSKAALDGVYRHYYRETAQEYMDD